MAAVRFSANMIGLAIFYTYLNVIKLKICSKYVVLIQNSRFRNVTGIQFKAHVGGAFLPFA
jgi:hypothetical protein